MDLQFGLAIVDQMKGDKETKQRMHGWMSWESKSGKRLRALGAQALLALAARLDAAVLLARQEEDTLTPVKTT